MKTYFFGCDSTCEHGECKSWHDGSCRHDLGYNISPSNGKTNLKINFEKKPKANFMSPNHLLILTGVGTTVGYLLAANGK